MPGQYHIQQHAPTRRKDGQKMSDDEREGIREELASLDKKLGSMAMRLISGVTMTILVAAGGMLIAGMRFQERTEVIQQQQSARITEVAHAIETHKTVDVPELRRTIQSLNVQLAVTAANTEALRSELQNTRADMVRVNQSLNRRRRSR